MTLVQDKELAEMASEEFRTRMVNIYSSVDELQEEVKRLEAKDAYYAEQIQEEEDKTAAVRELLYKKEKSVEYLEHTLGQKDKRILALETDPRMQVEKAGAKKVVVVPKFAKSAQTELSGEQLSKMEQDLITQNMNSSTQMASNLMINHPSPRFDMLLDTSITKLNLSGEENPHSPAIAEERDESEKTYNNKVRSSLISDALDQASGTGVQSPPSMKTLL